MPWLNGGLIDNIIKAAEVKGMAVDAWWRDPVSIEAWWREGGFETGKPSFLVPVSSGAGVIAWMRCVDVVECIGPVFTVMSIGPDEGKGCGTFKEIFGDIKKMPEAYVTQWSARDILNLKPNLASVGDRVACRDSSGAGRIGYCESLDSAGQVASVRFVNGSVEPARAMAKRWFKVENRDNAFDAFWAEGVDTWGSYMAMMSSLYHRHRKLNKASGVKTVTRKEREIPPVLIAPVKAADYVAPVPAISREEYDLRYRQGGWFYAEKTARAYIRDAMQEKHWEALEAGWDAAMADDLI